MREKLIKWHPIEKIPEKLYAEGIIDDYEGFRILLKGTEKTDKMLRIQFNVALAYRNSDEGDRLKSLSEWASYEKHSLFQVDESNFIDWFLEQNYSKYKKEELVHYLIMTPNDVIDVISLEKPNVEWLN